MPSKTNRSGEDRTTERVMIFIDGSNLYHVLGQNCGRHDLVFSKFIDKLNDGRQLQRTYYYNIRQDPSFNPQASSEQEKFLATLFETPYLEVRLGVHRRHGDTMVEKGVDVMMATDLVSGAFKGVYDTAVVVSGDGDFYPAIQAVKDLGKHVEVVAFDSNLSPEARHVADRTTILTRGFFSTLWTTRSRSTRSATKQSPQEVAGKVKAAEVLSRGVSGPPANGMAQPSAATNGRSEPEPADETEKAKKTPSKPASSSSKSGSGGASRSGRRGRGGNQRRSSNKDASSEPQSQESTSQPRRRLVSVTGTRGEGSEENAEGDTQGSGGWFRRRFTRRGGQEESPDDSSGE